MSKKISVFAILIATLAVGALAYAQEYNFQVSGLTYSGSMAATTDIDWLHLQGQEGVNPTICLQHAPGVDFEIAVFNNNSEVGRSTGTQPRTCVNARTPGTVKVKIWSFRGTGPYTVTIAP